MLHVLIVIVVVGVLLWAVHTYVPMAQPIKGILTAVVVIALVVWIFTVFGLLDGFPSRVRL